MSRPIRLGLVLALLAWPLPVSAQPVEAVGSFQLALRAQVQRCWSPDPSATGQIVVVDFHLNKDGSLAGMPRLHLDDVGATLPSPGAVNAALRAVETCAPYKLPAASYESWKDVQMTFDPTHMIN